MGELPPPETTVWVWFEDETIATLFSSLVEAKGYSTMQLLPGSQLSEDSWLVTEPQYLPQLSHVKPQRCLLVGSKGALQGYTGPTLSRPLTEEKVEQALEGFLG